MSCMAAASSAATEIDPLAPGVYPKSQGPHTRPNGWFGASYAVEGPPENWVFPAREFRSWGQMPSDRDTLIVPEVKIHPTSEHLKFFWPGIVLLGAGPSSGCIDGSGGKCTWIVASHFHTAQC